MNIFKRVLHRLSFYTFGFYPLVIQADFVRYLNDLSSLAKMQEHYKTVPVKSLTGFTIPAEAYELGEEFAACGSDKADKFHNYHLIYGLILSGKKEKPLQILEIGIGSNDLTVPSNMGSDWTPGGSLRAWRNFFHHARIYGADVDRKSLFEEERIKTFFVDQCSAESLKALSKKLPASFDLIIDDGLHTPQANLNTLMFAFPLLKKGATFVVEDILPQYLLFWRLVSIILPEEFETTIVKIQSPREGYVTFIKKV